jgi:outer membrane protein OmpA-like peptidoglycan-associated protein
MKTKWLFALTMVAVMLVSGLAFADTCAKKKVDGFVMLVDLSASRGKGFEMQMSLIDKLQTAVPAFDYKTAIRSFWLYPLGDGTESKLDYGVVTFEREGFVAALKSLEGHSGARTPLGGAIKATDADFAQMTGPKALIIFSDFEWSEGFGDPVAEAKKLAAKYPDLAIYSICFARKEAPVKVAEGVAMASKGGKPFDAENVVSDETQFNALIAELFTRTDPKACQKKVVMNLLVEFDTAKWFIRPIYHNRIAEVAKFMQDNPTANAVIEGHTDDQGTDQSNQVLSQKRVDSVRQYLIEKFNIDAGRLTAQGFGESKPIADNKTAAGRQKNRRVEVVFTGMTQAQ